MKQKNKNRLPAKIWKIFFCIFFAYQINFAGNPDSFAAYLSEKERQKHIPLSVKPQPKNPSRLLSFEDYKQVETGLSLLKRKHWAQAKNSLKKIKNYSAKNILLWSMSRKRANYKSGFLIKTYQSLTDWPDSKIRLKRIEEALIREKTPPDKLISWFEGFPPYSLQGKKHLAQAYLKTGQNKKAETLYQSIWKTMPLSASQQKHFITHHKITKGAAYQRADYFIWKSTSSNRKAAARLLPYLSRDAKKLVKARINFSARHKTASVYYKSLPSKLKNTPSLKFEYARWLRRKHEINAAGKLFKTLNIKNFPDYAQPALWQERKLQMRSALSEKNYTLAYQIISNHGMTDKKNKSHAEWLAGWLSLRYLNQAQNAVTHFNHFSDIVSTPISRARGYYWLGRSYEALNNLTDQQANYLKAAHYKTTFYGQLARDKLSLELALDTEVNLPAQTEDQVNRHTLFKPLEIALELDQVSLARKLFYQIEHSIDTKQAYLTLCELAIKEAYYDISVRLTKKAAQKKGYILLNRAYPVLHYFNQDKLTISKSLLLSLSRQESEFNPIIISHAGARGLMQLMPATARYTAKKHRISYKKAWLTQHPDYNVSLADRHVSDLVGEFKTDLPLMIAAYNAGTHNIKKWLKNTPYPNGNTEEIIDWIETIPFSETRNYVQRVMEAIGLYEYQLTGQTSQTLKNRLKKSSPVRPKTR